MGCQGVGEQPQRYLGVAGAWRDTVVRPSGHSKVLGIPRAVGCEKHSNPGSRAWQRAATGVS